MEERSETELRAEILDLVRQYHDVKFKKTSFTPGKSPVRYAGRVFDADELQLLVDASLDFWLTSGRYHDEFEANFAEFTGAENAYLVNSGSSANLVAFASLSSPLLGKRRLVPGDEVIS